MAFNLKDAVISLSTIGHLPDEDQEGKVKKSFLIYLALFMSGGGLLWGTIAIANGLTVQSLIPYGYTIITVFNLYYFWKSKNFESTRFVQIFISLILPFLFQWSLGGFFSSGALMLWSLLALVASPSFQSPKSSVIWLVMFVLLTTISAVFESFFYTLKPDILGDQSLLFIAVNATVIGSIIFFLVIYFVQRSNSAQEEIQVINYDLNKQQELITQQNETLESAIVETNSIITEALRTGNFDVRMNVNDKEGEWKNLALSINSLFDAITSPLSTVREISQYMSKGNLTRRFDEDANGQILLLKNSLNDSLDQFSSLLNQIRNQTDDIGESLNTMHQSSNEMSQGSSEINVAVTEISQGAATQLSKVDEASHLISMIAESAKDIDGQAKSINGKAQEGVNKSDQAISNVNELMEVVDKNYEYSSTLLDNCHILEEEAKRIASFTRLIDDIASQTNLLSLNAGIQAADAGEHGKGFAVVAEEIRTLADKAKGSVQEIDSLITGIQNKVSETQQTVVSINESIIKNKEFSNQIRDDFTSLVTSMQGVMNESETISESTSKQNNDLRGIVKLTESIVAIAEETASSSRSASDSSNGLADGMKEYMKKNESILSLAKELYDQTNRFVLDEEKPN